MKRRRSGENKVEEGGGDRGQKGRREDLKEGGRSEGREEGKFSGASR